MASRRTIDSADHHAAENHRTEAASEIETRDFNLVPEEDEENYAEATYFDKSEEPEADIGVKVFYVMLERGDADKSGKGVSQLLAEIEMLDSMIERSTVGLLDLQVMKGNGSDHGNFICTSYGNSGNKIKYEGTGFEMHIVLT